MTQRILQLLNLALQVLDHLVLMVVDLAADALVRGLLDLNAAAPMALRLLGVSEIEHNLL